MWSDICRSCLQFLKSEDGPTAVEYAVMLSLILVVCVSAIQTLGNNTAAKFANNTLKQALGGS